MNILSLIFNQEEISRCKQCDSNKLSYNLGSIKKPKIQISCLNCSFVEIKRNINNKDIIELRFKRGNSKKHKGNY